VENLGSSEIGWGERNARERSTLWAIHPGGPAILDRIETSLGLRAHDLHAARHILRHCGNMSSATIFFVFEELLRAGHSGSGIALAFGPGLTVEGLRFELGAGEGN
jgi:predicted naringenin-chalcone synthase